MPLKTIVNGIDVDRQRATAAAGVVPDPSEVTASTEWLGSTETRTVVTTAAAAGLAREFTIDSDYPASLLGSGRAASPGELFIASASASFVTSFVLAAAAANVRVESMRVLASARIAVDVPGPQAKEPPLADLELRAAVDADTSTAHLKQLGAIAAKHASIIALCRLDARVRIDPVDRGTEEVRR